MADNSLFKVGQKVRIASGSSSWYGSVGHITKPGGYDYCYVYLDDYGEYCFYYHNLELIKDIPGKCNECDSVVPKDRTLCCSCAVWDGWITVWEEKL